MVDSPEAAVGLSRKALAVVATTAGADPFALWSTPRAKTPDVVHVLENGGRVMIEAITEQVIPCPGVGTLTVIRDDQGLPWPSQGDSHTRLFSDCLQGQATLNGVRRYTLVN